MTGRGDGTHSVLTCPHTGTFVSAHGHIRVRPRAGFVTAYGQKPMSLDTHAAIGTELPRAPASHENYVRSESKG